MTIPIPAEALEAMRTALEKCNGGQQFYLNECLPAAQALLSAWPGMSVETDVTGWDVHVELPLPQEANDVAV